ncbi:multicopper oxidase domain-containing protein [Haloparvum sp. PAK95]|uniref:multicopper oxidase domain-containing protein n=1 Tax=Haloparvum sp. PAK95 TaxID=3418962 RepID=UPI003D2F2525
MTRNDRSRTLSRRGVLKAAGLAGLSGLAGCLAPSDTGSGGANAATPTATPTTGENAWDGDPTSVETDHDYTGSPQVVDLDEQDGQVTIRTVPCRHELVGAEAKGEPLELPEVWAFQADDREPSVPGPTLRVTEGTTMEVTFENTAHNRPHTLHMHGIRKDWEDDGVPSTTGITVGPGETHTYELEANVPGTHFYHCHFQTDTHLDLGMYGILRVDPKDYEEPDREYFMTVKEWDTRLSAMTAGADVEYSTEDRDPDEYTINGRAAPTTFHPEKGTPIVVSEDDDVRVHMVNAGYINHAMHPHNHRSTLVAKDGGTIPEASRHKEDVFDVAPAQRYTIDFPADADPGIYPFHCHRVNHALTDGQYPGGMLTGIAYESEMDSEEFASLMDAAGYEG